MTAKLSSLQVNGIEITWDDQDAREAKPCEKCGRPTKGRLLAVQDDVPSATVVCMDCFPALMFAPVAKTVKLIAAAFGEVFGGQS